MGGERGLLWNKEAGSLLKGAHGVFFLFTRSKSEGSKCLKKQSLRDKFKESGECICVHSRGQVTHTNARTQMNSVWPAPGAPETNQDVCGLDNIFTHIGVLQDNTGPREAKIDV